MNKNLREQIKGSIIATVGYLLSPLSWWNDLYINVPLAYVLAWLVSLADKRLFGASMVFFYWITNLAGLLLLHKGLSSAVKGNNAIPQTGRSIFFDILMSIAYSGILALLVYTGLLRHPEEYFK
jgi:hypothetical protein